MWWMDGLDEGGRSNCEEGGEAWTYEDLFGGVGDGVKVDKVFEVLGEAEEGGGHDVFEVVC